MGKEAKETYSEAEHRVFSLVLAPVKDKEASIFNKMYNAMAFHRYMDLPFEVRGKILAKTIDQHERMQITKKEGTWQFKVNQHNNLARLASVSQEWRKDVEKILFAHIRVDPSNEEDVLRFKEVFTHERRRFLKSLDIIIDDGETGPWHKRTGLLEISQAMEKIGRLFQFINSWDVFGGKDDQQSIEITFSSSSSHAPDFDSASPSDPSMHTTSLWMTKNLNRATRSGLVPTNVVLWAINSEFPSSLNMVTHLTFPPDCVPLNATEAILRRLPNLTSCNFELAFQRISEGGWGNFAEFINKLPALVPSLRDLNIQNPRIHESSREALIFNPKRLSTAIRDYGQSLRYLCVRDFTMHQIFFLPFSDRIGTHMAMPQLRWPKLEILSLTFATYRPYAGPGRLGLTAAELLVAAGRAAVAMPVLRLFQAEVLGDPDGDQYKDLQVIRELSVSSGGSAASSVRIIGCSEYDDRRILDAWTPFFGAEARLVKEEEIDSLDSQIRRFYTTCSDGQE